jgi:hypothetical protein
MGYTHCFGQVCEYLRIIATECITEIEYIMFILLSPTFKISIR